MSFIVISLTNRTFISLVDYIFRNKSSLNRQKSKESSRDSCFCAICNVNDDHEIIYSKFDLDYVLNLFNRNNQFSENNKYLNKIDANNLNEKLNYCKIISNNKETKIRKLLNMIYKSDRNFRFTSRYINSILVAFVALYYFFIFTLYIFVELVINLHDGLNLINKSVGKIQELTDYFSHEQQITLKELCEIQPDYFCFDSLMNVSFTLPQIPQVVSVLNYTGSKLVQINFTSSFESIIIVPIFFAFLICLLQLFLFIRETRLHLLQLYRGQCEFVLKVENLSNGEIGKIFFILEKF